MCSLWDLIFCHSALGFLDSSCCSVSAVAAVLSWTCSDAFLGIPAGLPLWILGMDWLRHRCASVIFREMLDGSSVVLEQIYTPMRSFKGACCSTSWPALSSITRCTFLPSKWVENNVSLWSLCPCPWSPVSLRSHCVFPATSVSSFVKSQLMALLLSCLSFLPDPGGSSHQLPAYIFPRYSFFHFLQSISGGTEIMFNVVRCIHLVIIVNTFLMFPLIILFPHWSQKVINL